MSSGTRYRHLFSPLRLGPVTVENRIVFSAHLTNYADDGLPSEQHAAYYEARAAGGAGLIITEGTQVSPQGVGYIRTPGIHSAEQVAGWKTVTAGVHRAGGKIFAQLWHVGRVSHPNFHDGALPVAYAAAELSVEHRTALEAWLAGASFEEIAGGGDAEEAAKRVRAALQKLRRHFREDDP